MKTGLGNRGTIRGGECQWMTAGSGILHQEMPLESPRMLGIQLWLNLPSSEKMTDPSYLSITQKQIVTAQTASGPVKVLSGFFRGIHGMIPPHIRASLYDITLNPGRRLSLSTRETDTVFLFYTDRELPHRGSCHSRKIRSPFRIREPNTTAGAFRAPDSYSIRLCPAAE